MCVSQIDSRDLRSATMSMVTTTQGRRALRSLIAGHLRFPLTPRSRSFVETTVAARSGRRPDGSALATLDTSRESAMAERRMIGSV